MSLFASALDTQDGMSVSITDVNNQFKDFPEDDRKSAVAQYDDADVHNSTAAIGDVVSEYHFMSWLDGDDPDALAMEDRFFCENKLISPTMKRRWTNFHPNHVIVTPQTISCSPPFLLLDMQLIAKIHYQNTLPNSKIQGHQCGCFLA
jgi:hypothetical protein